MDNNDPFNPLKPRNPFVIFNPPDTKELNTALGGETAAAKSLQPGAAPGETKKKKTKLEIKEESRQDQIQRYIRRRHAQLYRIDEVSPPGEEDWIIKRKADFQKRYGDRWKEVLYATAWKRHNLEEETIELAEGCQVQDVLGQSKDFIEYASGYLNLGTVPPIRFKETEAGSTFATWSPDAITISVTNRHPMDVFRSVAHELVHHKQHEDDVLHAESGVTGSEHENEANAVAGIIMRDWARQHPEMFALDSIEEGLIGHQRFGGAKIHRIIKPRRGASPSGSGGLGILRSVKKLFKGSKKKPESHSSEPKPQKHEPDFEEKVQKGLARRQVQDEIKRRLEAQKQASAREEIKKNHEERQKTKAELKKISADAPLKRTKGAIKPPTLAEREYIVLNKRTEGEINLRETIALTRKAQKSGIPFEIIQEVYQRGQKDWQPGGHLTMEQWAFNRVNSFIAGGKAVELDKDLFIVKEKPEVDHT